MLEKLGEYKKIVQSLIKLALPILEGNISQILLGITDAAVAGHYSTVALGAMSVAVAIITSTTVAAIGLIISVSVVISNMRGKRMPTKELFKSTILFSLIVIIPFILLLELFLYNINILHLAPDLVLPVKQYVGICVWSLIPMSIFIALKEFLQAYEKVVFTNTVMIFTVFLNVILNIMLVFGFNGFGMYIPSLGVAGVAIATLLCRIFSCIVLLIYCYPLFKTKFKISKEYYKELFKVGTPISASIFFEFLGFNFTAIIIGKFSAVLTGAHTVLLNIANLTFIMVLSIANAASVKISYYFGKRDYTNIFRYSVSNIGLVLGICIVMFIILLNFSDSIISLFTKDLEVFYHVKNVMILVICFLFFDGLQGACVGILKGLKETKIIMLATIFGYMLVAIPVGCYLAFYKNIVLDGFWFGLSLAIISIAIITFTRVVLNLKRLKEVFN